MKEAFVTFIRELREPVRAQRQEKIREVELAWSADEFASFRQFVMGLHSSEKADVCHALANAQARPLLEILADFAENNPNLMNMAFESIEKTSQEARIFLAKKLIVSPKADVRAKTCAMLGGTGPQSRSLLEAALADKDAEVRLAAVNAVSRGNFKNLAQNIPPLLRDDDEKVRFAALETIARFGTTSTASENDLLAILRDGNQDEPSRRLAAGILARAANASARIILLEALRKPDAPVGLRLAAAESLSAYNDLEAITAVMQAADDSDAYIAQIASMALNRKTSGAFESILTQIISSTDERLASQAATLLGGLDSSLAQNMLMNRLTAEQRIPVINAIARAMGKGNVPGAWDALMAKQKQEHIDDPDFFAALVDVASEENLAQYASFFDLVDKRESKYAIMESLANFALASPVPSEIRALAIRVLNDSDESLHIAAATILAHMPDLNIEDATLVLTRLSQLKYDSQVSGVTLAMLRVRHGALAQLFQNAPSETCQILAYAASEATCIGDGAESLFCKVANWARTGVPHAVESLRVMAFLAPDALVKAMAKCGDQIFLLDAWSKLSTQERTNHRPNFRAFFANASEQDALTAIPFLDNLTDQRNLQDLADLAFTSQYSEVRNAAVSRARTLILTQ